MNGTLRPTAGGCGAPPAALGLAVEFGDGFRTEAAADKALKHVVGLGFVQACVEQAGCASYLIVETGIPDVSVGESIVDEAHAAKLEALLVNR